MLHQQPLGCQLLASTYYYIKNSTRKYLSLNKSINYQQQQIILSKQINTIRDIWMIQQVSAERFQIIHVVSGMVWENVKGDIRLRPGKWKKEQLFYIQRINSIDQYNISEYKNSNKHVQFDNKLQCSEKISPHQNNNKWCFQKVKQNQHRAIYQTCILEFYQSNLVMDVPKGSSKAGQKIIQYTLNKRFNQRWYIQKSGIYYIIKNLFSDLVLDIEGQSQKQGTSVIQYSFKDKLNQKWILQRHGKGLYIIRSALNNRLMISVKGNSLKDQTELIITKNQSNSFWRIIGIIPE